VAIETAAVRLLASQCSERAPTINAFCVTRIGALICGAGRQPNGCDYVPIEGRLVA
jgi:hypothetical protein